MTLESSVEEFTSRFAAHAARGTLYPQPEGSPLLEFLTGGRVLYLFDRSGPYAARPGEARVVVHGVVESWAPSEAREEAFHAVGVSAIEGVGEVVDAGPRWCVVRCRAPIVLGLLGPRGAPKPSGWIAFRTAPPLHGFIVSSDGFQTPAGR